MNFDEWWKKMASQPKNRWMHGKNKKTFQGWMNGGWVGCKQEILNLLKSKSLVNMSEIEEAELLEKINKI
jgi:hypothetical protein